MLQINLLPDEADREASAYRGPSRVTGSTCVRCGHDVPVAPLLGLCETCTRLDLAFEASTSRRHASGKGVT